MLNLCLIGKDIKNSRSPELYKMMAKRDNIELNYELRNLDIDEIKDFVREVQLGKYNGFNVTAPYKKEIIQYLDYISEDAESIEAVNTVYNDNGILKGYNTDIYGAFESIKPILKNGSILILGRGGAARAVVRAFKDYDLTLYTRDDNNDELLKIKSDIKFIYDLKKAEFINVINATDVGFNSDETILYEPLKTQLTAIDLIYTPPKTKFLKVMEDNGLIIKNGYDMLKFQAEMSYRIFLGEINWE